MSAGKFFRGLGSSEDTSHTTREGQQYYWYHRKRRNKSPPVSTLFLQHKFPVEFSIAPEGWFQKLSKSLGFATEFQTNDLDFDNKFYISSDDPQFCNKLRAGSIRQSIKTIFNFGVKAINTEKGRFNASMRDASPVPDPAVADPVAKEMHALAEQISSIALNPLSPCKSLAKQAQIAMWFMIGSLIAAVVCVATFSYKLVDYTGLLRSSALYAVPVIFAMFFIVRVVFSGSSRGTTVFGAALLAGIPAIALASYDAHYYLNVYHDQSEPTFRTQYVNRTYTTRHKNRTRYHVEVDNWHRPGEKLSISIGYATYNRIRPGSRIVLKTHPGYLGAEWIEDYEVFSR